MKAVQVQIRFAIFNTIAFIAFSVLWDSEFYYANWGLVDKIDDVDEPLVWLIGFFTASFLARKEYSLKSALISLGYSFAFSFFLFLFVRTVLPPWS